MLLEWMAARLILWSLSSKHILYGFIWKPFRPKRLKRGTTDQFFSRFWLIMRWKSDCQLVLRRSLSASAIPCYPCAPYIHLLTSDYFLTIISDSILDSQFSYHPIDCESCLFCGTQSLIAMIDRIFQFYPVISSQSCNYRWRDPCVTLEWPQILFFNGVVLNVQLDYIFTSRLSQSNPTLK